MRKIKDNKWKKSEAKPLVTRHAIDLHINETKDYIYHIESSSDHKLCGWLNFRKNCISRASWACQHTCFEWGSCRCYQFFHCSYSCNYLMNPSSTAQHAVTLIPSMWQSLMCYSIVTSTNVHAHVHWVLRGVTEFYGGHWLLELGDSGWLNPPTPPFHTLASY